MAAQRRTMREAEEELKRRVAANGGKIQIARNAAFTQPFRSNYLLKLEEDTKMLGRAGLGRDWFGDGRDWDRFGEYLCVDCTILPLCMWIVDAINLQTQNSPDLRTKFRSLDTQEC